MSDESASSLILNVFEEGELSASSTVAKFATVQTDEAYESFAARRRSALEAQGEADLLGLLNAEVKKLPKSRHPKGGKP